MNVSYFKTRNYEQKPMDDKPTKQTQSNPIELAFIGERRPAIAFSSSIALAKEEATAGKRIQIKCCGCANQPKTHSQTVISPMRSIVRNFAFCLLIFDFYNDTTCSG